jgi:hypothetical protein
MTIYEPKVIISNSQIQDFQLLMARELANYIRSEDPPNPFRGPLESSDHVKIALNKTNDLKYMVDHWISEIKNGDADIVLLGDPFRHGYSMQVINKIADACDVPCNYIVAKDWIVFCLNLKDMTSLYIKDSTIMKKEASS